MNDGWNVKFPKEKDDIDPEEDTRNPYLLVSMNFDTYAPKIVLIDDVNGNSLLDKDSVAMLDWADIESCDIVIRPYNWSVNGNSGKKAYLKSLYVKISSDEFASKYGI